MRAPIPKFETILRRFGTTGLLTGAPTSRLQTARHTGVYLY
ncbi:MAG: hypothetical protein WAK01_20165 [Methylocystis sp.]